MKEVEITRGEELNDRETEEIASVLEGARPSNRIDVDRKKLRDHLNHMLTETGLIHSPEGDDEDPAFEEAFAEHASEPESARELRDQYRELADLIGRLERKLRRDDLAPALVARLRWLSARRPQGARTTKAHTDKKTGFRFSTMFATPFHWSSRLPKTSPILRQARSRPADQGTSCWTS